MNHEQSEERLIASECVRSVKTPIQLYREANGRDANCHSCASLIGTHLEEHGQNLEKNTKWFKKYYDKSSGVGLYTFFIFELFTGKLTYFIEKITS